MHNIDLQSWLNSKFYLTENIKPITTSAGEGLIVKGTLTNEQEQKLTETAHRPSPKTMVLKYGSRSFVGSAPIADIQLAVKYYYRLSLRRQIGYTIYGSRAMRSWIASRAFTHIGIPTPQPIALIESKRFGFLTDRALFATLIALGTPLPQFLKEHHENSSIMTTVAEHAQKIFSQLSKHRIYHSDANAKNFIVLPDHTLSIIDLDAVEFFVPQKKWLRKRASDEKQFSRIWQQYPHLKDIFKNIFKV